MYDVQLSIQKFLALGPFHTENFYFESQPKFRKAKFREIFFKKIERSLL